MPDPASRLPPRPSLEQLRKQAKDLLADYRVGVPDASERFHAVIPRISGTHQPVLADAQFVIAREYGFETWPALKQYIESTTRPDTLRRYETLASDLAAADAGDEAALRRLSEIFDRSMTVDRLRTQIRRRLADVKGADADLGTLSLDDARLVVARQYDFDTWAALADVIGPPTGSSRGSGAAANRAPFYQVDLAEGCLEVRAPLSDRDWDAVFAAIQDLRLTSLDAGRQMTDAVLARLPQLRHLASLDIAWSAGATDAGVRHLSQMPALTSISLGGSGVTDRGLEVLRDLPWLRTLHLQHHQNVSDRGAANLADCHELEFADLMGTPTGDGAIAALGGKPALRRVYGGNAVTDAGLALFHRIPAFKTWRGGGIDFSLGGFDAEPTYVFLNMKAALSDQGLANLVGLDGLFALNLFGTTGFPAFDDSRCMVTEAGIAHLRALPHLGWLGCCARLGSDAVMAQVAAMPRLRLLFGQDMIAGNDGFAALSASRTIEGIAGRRCHHLRDRGLAALAAMPSLRGLSVSCKNVGDEGLSALPRFPALQELVAIDIGDDGYRHIGRCPRMETLWFGSETTDAATRHIEALATLTYVSLAGKAVTDASLEVLARMPQLEVIELHTCRGVTDAGLALIAESPNLRRVTLGGVPRVTRQAARAIFPPHVAVVIPW